MPRPARRRVALLAALIGAVGCVSDKSEHRGWLERTSASAPAADPNVFHLEYTVVERVIGAPEIDREVWRHTDQLVLPAETRSMLEEQGIRVGVVRGMPPAAIESLVAAPKSVTGRRLRRFQIDSPATLNLESARPQFRYHDPADPAKSSARILTDAQPQFDVMVEQVSPGQCRLRLTPQIEHHSTKLAEAKELGWGVSSALPIEKFDSLKISLTLRDDDLLVIGTDVHKADTLGHALFTAEAEGKGVQRLFLVRPRPGGALASETSRPVSLEPVPNPHSASEDSSE